MVKRGSVVQGSSGYGPKWKVAGASGSHRFAHARENADADAYFRIATAVRSIARQFVAAGPDVGLECMDAFVIEVLDAWTTCTVKMQCIGALADNIE